MRQGSCGARSVAIFRVHLRDTLFASCVTPPDFTLFYSRILGENVECESSGALAPIPSEAEKS
jgi:hypothetical protein